ncbi:MAG TPA: PEGA domain-containing protein [Deltaproteobacteria bacterium]|nr:MAG: hypothetical protein A3D29_03885 [Deltaproteobacteria bacterium RIFCSPHIGHO2_02_FULL_42_44]OGQ35385.1 MAG: hypothetical protein A3H47_08280 [Deltaproteobacteria bacterium RIFCSPLOWO2_02_FULL_42_39]HCY19218.1 PEGA domain-containing protein [Deltaproteobacteria bacterium]
MKKLAYFTLAISLSACSSTTVINSDPNGAMVFLNGEKAGVTPYMYTDTKIIGSTNTVLLKKEGYQDFSTVFSRNENANVGAIIGGVFVLVPFLWAMDYKPSHSYEMVPLKGAANQ